MLIVRLVMFTVTMMVGDGSSDDGSDGGDVDGKGLAMVMWNGFDDGGSSDSLDGVDNELAMVRGHGIDDKGIGGNGDFDHTIGSDMIAWWRYW